jgi:hypothetical protein
LWNDVVDSFNQWLSEGGTYRLEFMQDPYGRFGYYRVFEATGDGHLLKVFAVSPYETGIVGVRYVTESRYIQFYPRSRECWDFIERLRTKALAFREVRTMDHPVPRDTSQLPTWHNRRIALWHSPRNSIQHLRSPIEAIEWLRRNAERPIRALQQATTHDEQDRIYTITERVINDIAMLHNGWLDEAETERQFRELDLLKELLESYVDEFMGRVARLWQAGLLGNDFFDRAQLIRDRAVS